MGLSPSEFGELFLDEFLAAAGGPGMLKPPRQARAPLFPESE